jgi:hypothetical protein
VSIFIESRYKVTFGDQNWKLTIRFEVIQVTTLRVSAKARSHVAIFMKSKRNEVTTINIVQTQVEKCILYVILSVGMPLYQEGYHMDYQQSLNAQQILKT